MRRRAVLRRSFMRVPNDSRMHTAIQRPLQLGRYDYIGLTLRSANYWRVPGAHSTHDSHDGTAVKAEAVTKRSGTPTTPNAKRTRPMVTITLSPEALARLDAIAAERGRSRSGAVEQLVRNARLGKSGL